MITKGDKGFDETPFYEIFDQKTISAPKNIFKNAIDMRLRV